MKITTNYLRQVIKEELKAVLAEEEKNPWDDPYDRDYREDQEDREEKNPWGDPDADDRDDREDREDREDKNPWALQEEEKSPEWQKAYDEKYKEIANGLIHGKINPFKDKENFSPEDLDFYRGELNMRRFEPYGGSGDDIDAMILLARRKAEEYANNNS